MALPEPVLSGDEIKAAMEIILNPSSPIKNTWSTDPTKLTVLRAVISWHATLSYSFGFIEDIFGALTQKLVCFLHYYSLKVEEVHY